MEGEEREGGMRSSLEGRRTERGDCVEGGWRNASRECRKEREVRREYRDEIRR